jgi:O-antigen ligase
MQDLFSNILLVAIPALLVAPTMYPTEQAAKTGGGLLLVLLWIAVFLLWAARAYFSHVAFLRFNLIDLLILGTIVWHSISAILLVTGKSGSARPAINMGWEWVGYGACYFLVRQVFTTYRRQLALLIMFVCLTTMLASCGLYQYFHLDPAARQAYQNSSEEEKQQLLIEAGVFDPRPESRERELFENRFLSSKEPLATFSLTNSFAGVITPWLIIAIGFGAVLIRYLRDDETSESDQSMVLGLAIAFLLMAGCLLLTKSRSAIGATFIGTIMIVFTAFAKSDSLRRISLYALAGICIVFLVFAFWIGGIDWEVIKEAPLSVKYRLEYWTATSQMIQEHPMFGVGPGNFQTNYMQYQLPQSGEEIAEPHNFLFEIAATAGIPALLMLAGGIGLWFWRVFPAAREDAEQTPDIMQADLDAAEEESLETHPPHNDSLLFCGAIIGLASGCIFSLANGFGIRYGMLIVGFIPALILAVIFVNYMRSIRSLDTLPLGRWIVAAAIGYFANLLAAGALGFPAVAYSGFVLLALGMNVPDALLRKKTKSRFDVTDRLQRLDKSRCVFYFMGGVLLMIACQFTAIGPVMAARQQIAEIERQLAAGKLEIARPAIERLRLIEPYDSQVPWLELQCAFAEWQREGYRESKVEPVQIAAANLVAADPHSNRFRYEIAQRYLLAAYQTADQQNAASRQRYSEIALENLQAAVKLRPNEALLRTRLAWTFLLNDDPQSARKQATEALRLDGLNPHADRALTNRPQLFNYLTPEMQLQMVPIRLEPGPPANAEQWAQLLRTISEIQPAENDSGVNP